MRNPFKKTVPTLRTALRNPLFVTAYGALSNLSFQSVKPWLNNPFPKPPAAAFTSRLLCATALLALIAVTATSCKHTCDAVDPLGLIGEWDAEEGFERYENGQLVQNLPNAYTYKFMAGHAGERTHINGIYPTETFSWTVDSDGAGLFIHRSIETETSSNTEVIRYTVQTNTEQSKSFQAEYNTFIVNGVTFDTTYIETVLSLNLQKN